MDPIQRYKIQYTAAAVDDIAEKFLYIKDVLKSPTTAIRWYENLISSIKNNLSTYPGKYALYHNSPRKDVIIRFFIVKNDLILYQVDEVNKTVFILLCVTKNRNMRELLQQRTLK